MLCLKHGYSLEWKIGETPRLADNGKSITCTMDNFVLLVVPGLSSVPAAVCLQHRAQQISKIIPDILDYYQIQSRLEVTSMHAGNRCWQILTHRPREAVNQHTNIFPTNCTRRIQRKVFLIGYSPSQLISRTWRCTCLYIHLKERTQIRMVMLQKWRNKNGSTVFLLTSAKTERDLVHEQKRLVTWKQWSAKVNLGTITSSLPWYKISLFSGYYPWKTQTSTRDGEEFAKACGAVTEAKSYSYGRFLRIWQILWRIIMEPSDSYISSIRDKKLQKELYVEYKKTHQAYYCNLDWMKNDGQIPWNAITICKMSKICWQTGNLRYERRSGESFKGPFFQFDALVGYLTKTLRKMKQDFTNLESEEPYWWCIIRGGISENILITDIGELEKSWSMK